MNISSSIFPYVRWAVARDLTSILEIEQASFTDPWGECIYGKYARQRNVITNVLESSTEPGLIYGHGVYAVHKHAVELLRLAVRPEYRRLGVGTRFLRRVFRRLKGGKRLTCEVRESSLDSCLFLKAFGFQATHIVRGSFGDEDGYFFQFHQDDYADLAEEIGGEA